MHLALAFAVVLGAGTPNAGFEKLKTLEGNWRADSKIEGSTFLSLTVVGGDAALLETMTGKDRSKILTTAVYSVEGGELVMNHYCAQGNQPHMKGKTEPGKIKFEAEPKSSHLSGVTFLIKDSDHFTEEWTSDGKKIVYEFQREYVDTLK
ncbi:MAG: hypothetical protein ACJ790_12625 [Myxococcaceae bacterium]